MKRKSKKKRLQSVGLATQFESNCSLIGPDTVKTLNQVEQHAQLTKDIYGAADRADICRSIRPDNRQQAIWVTWFDR